MLLHALITTTLKIAIFIPAVIANVEKLIFIAPPREYAFPKTSLRLTPSKPNLLTMLNTSLASIDRCPSPEETGKRTLGVETWMAIEDLEPGRRYEVRICWAATSPTEFFLKLHTLLEVESASELPAGDGILLSEEGSRDRAKDGIKIPSSSLYLRIFSKADYYTTDWKKMLHPEPVKVEIILDPYVFNVFPQSLIPMGMTIIGIVPIVWMIARLLHSWLVWMAATAVGEKTKRA